MNQLTQVQATLLAAIVGATSALIVVIIKDLIIEGRRQKRREKRELLDRQLTQLYSPLWVSLGGMEGALQNIFINDEMRKLLAANFHLLSPELQALTEDCLLLVRKDGDRYVVNVSDMNKLIKLDPKYKEVLKKDMSDLQKQLFGKVRTQELDLKPQNPHRKRARK